MCKCKNKAYFKNNSMENLRKWHALGKICNVIFEVALFGKKKFCDINMH